jgi:hypothetical protein
VQRRLLIGAAAGLAAAIAGGVIALGLAQPHPSKLPAATVSRPVPAVTSLPAPQPSPSASAAVSAPGPVAISSQITEAPVITFTSPPAAPAPTPPSRPPAPGTLSVSENTGVGLPPGAVGCYGTSVINTGSLTLQAIGGPVTWTATVTAAALISGQPGNITVSPASGTLAAGQAQTVAVTCNPLEPYSAGEITFEPGSEYVPIYGP